jgi:hypothetical protein
VSNGINSASGSASDWSLNAYRYGNGYESNAYGIGLLAVLQAMVGFGSFLINASGLAPRDYYFLPSSSNPPNITP